MIKFWEECDKLVFLHGDMREWIIQYMARILDKNFWGMGDKHFLWLLNEFKEYDEFLDWWYEGDVGNMYDDREHEKKIKEYFKNKIRETWDF